MWWKTAHAALKGAVESGWRNHSFVWASTPTVSDVVHVQPADFLMLFGDVSGRHRRFQRTDRKTCICVNHNRPQ